MKNILRAIFPVFLVFGLSACQINTIHESIQAEDAVEVYSQTRKGYILELTVDGDVYPVEILDGLVIFEGDMILGSVDELESGELTTQGITQDRICNPFCRDSRWNNKTIPFKIDSGVSASMTTKINNAISHWEANTTLNFRTKLNTDNDYVLFRIHGNGCSADVGRRGGKQHINLISNCSEGNIIHEIGHAIGLMHEHTRCDRDNFVRINNSNIEFGKGHNFDKNCGSKFTDRNSYDFDSIMHYSRFAFSKNGQATIDCINQTCPANMGQRTTLSALDILTVESFY
jgi:hypothetical protein